MELKEIKNRLGYKTVKVMLETYGYTETNISRIKRVNPIRFQMIQNDIIMQHHNIDTQDLIKLIELRDSIKEMQQDTTQHKNQLNQIIRNIKNPSVIQYAHYTKMIRKEH